MKQISNQEAKRVGGGFFFVLLAFDVAIWGYNAYRISR